MNGGGGGGGLYVQVQVRHWARGGEGGVDGGGNKEECTGERGNGGGRVVRSYLKLENSMFIPLGCELPKQNARCCSSSLHVASL